MTGINGGNGWHEGNFRIVSREQRDWIVVAVHGEIDLTTAPKVEDELLRAVGSHTLAALDLSDTSFMDSTGLHAIIVAHRRMRERGGRLVVVPGPPQIRRLFAISGIGNHLELIDDAAELEGSAHQPIDPRPQPVVGGPPTR